MTETPEEIKAKARALRNKKPTNTAFVNTDPFNAKQGGSKQGSQTNIKPARKPSV